MTKKGLLFIISGPAGSGKGTLVKRVRELAEFDFSVSATTRGPRPGEIDGVHYFFVKKEEFEKKIAAGEMLEYAEYVGNYYGTPLSYVNKTLDEGKDVFLEIEVQGAQQVKEKVPDGVFIFLTPPDLAELKSRIVGRGTDADEVIEERMKVAKEEIEMMALYDYAVVNDQVPLAVERIKNIIASEHFRVDRVIGKYIKMLKEM